MPISALDTDVCLDCLAEHGLCHQHTKGILPELARNIGWLKMIGNPLTEQTARQDSKRRQSPQSAQSKAHAQRKLAAKRPRRGYRGLLSAIQAA